MKLDYKNLALIVFILLLCIGIYFVFFNKEHIAGKKIIQNNRHFKLVDASYTNDHYGFWKNTDAFYNYKNMKPKQIRKYQASYLHKSKPVVYKYKNTYTCVGFGLANSVFIVSDNCVIVNDVGTDTIQGKEMIKVIESVTSKPVKYVIYGHNHIDHTGGIGAYLERWPKLKIIAHKNIEENVSNTSTVISNILGVRSAKHAGIYVPDDLFDHAGIGPHKEVNTQYSTYRKPDIILENETKTLDLCGEKLIFMWAPSETDDELCMYYPKHKILFTNEIINPSAPSSYTLRGTKRRDIKVWINTLDQILNEFSGAQYMAPTHGRPVVGNSNVIRRIREYKEGTEEMYNQTMKLMNEGKSPDVIEHSVKVPDYLNTPWNYFDHYNYQASFPKAIYQNYLGHYNGDPYTLLINKESHPHERACYFAKNTNKVFKDVDKMVKKGEKAFASQLLTYIINCPSSSEADIHKAKKMKSDLYMEIAEEQTSSNLRNWLISDALLLQNKIEPKNINFKVEMV